MDKFLSVALREDIPDFYNSTILQFHLADAFIQSDVQHKQEFRLKEKPLNAEVLQL